MLICVFNAPIYCKISKGALHKCKKIFKDAVTSDTYISYAHVCIHIYTCIYILLHFLEVEQIFTITISLLCSFHLALTFNNWLWFKKKRYMDAFEQYKH